MLATVMSLDCKEEGTIHTLFSPSLKFQQLAECDWECKKFKRCFTPNIHTTGHICTSWAQTHTPTSANLLKDASINNPLVNPTFLESLLRDIRQVHARPFL
jgi:hypothetical protein